MKPRDGQRSDAEGGKDLHTYRPPEQFEKWLSEEENERKVVPVGAWLIGGAICWVIFAWIIVVKYW